MTGPQIALDGLEPERPQRLDARCSRCGAVLVYADCKAICPRPACTGHDPKAGAGRRDVSVVVVPLGP